MSAPIQTEHEFLDRLRVIYPARDTFKYNLRLWELKFYLLDNLKTQIVLLNAQDANSFHQEIVNRVYSFFEETLGVMYLNSFPVAQRIEKISQIKGLVGDAIGLGIRLLDEAAGICRQNRVIPFVDNPPSNRI